MAAVVFTFALQCIVGVSGQSTSTSEQDKINPLDVENQNSNEHLSTDGTFWTLGINIFMFAVFCLIFEANRFYPQIYLKRCVKKFIDTSRVPPRPPEMTFGWLWSLWQVSEDDVLAMVGLDGFMLLRFHIVCLKLCCFLSFWGLLVLTPLYSTAAITSTWDTYTLTNVLKGEDRMKFRLWAAAVFGYIFSAYFCKLLQTEYNAFCIRRLIYLTQQYNQETAVEGGALSGDPDTPQQTYYTVMVERLPKDLRSPQKLRNYFDDIFPGEVYAVEVMYDLSELNALCAKRHDIQNKLEHAIADYEVTGTRPVVFIQSERPFLSPGYPPELEARYLPPITSWVQCLDRLLAPEEYGFEPHDSIHYYTNELIELNKKVKELQEPHDDAPSTRQSGAGGSGSSESGPKQSSSKKKNKDVMELAKEKGTVAGALASKLTDASSAGLKSTREYLRGFSATRAMTNFLFGEESSDFSRELIKQERRAMRKTSRALSVSRERKNSRDSASGSPAKDPGRDRAGSGGSGGSGGARERRRSRSCSDPGLEAELAALGVASSSSSSSSSFAPIGNDVDAGSGNDSTGIDVGAEPIGSSSGLDGDGDGDGDDVSVTSTSTGSTHSSDDLGEPLDLDAVNPHELTPASFMRKLSVSRKQSKSRAGSSTEGELQAAGVVAGASALAAAETAASAVAAEPLAVITNQPFSSPSPGRSIDLDMTTNSVEGEGWRDLDPQSAIGLGVGLDPGLAAGSAGEPTVSGLTMPSGLSMPTTSSLDSDLGAVVTSPTQSRYHPQAQSQPHAAAHAKAKSRSKKTRAQDQDTGTGVSGSSRNFTDGVEMAKSTWRFLSTQAADAAEGLKRGIIEGEKLVEMMAFGSFYKLSSTAFVTFKSRVTTAIARQMLISHDDMQIVAAPNPKDIIWENIDKPRSLLVMRHAVCEVGVVIASIFWSSLVTEVNAFSTLLNLPHAQQELLSVVILLCFLLILPFIFDWVARNYECMKLESEIQNSIMNRYFWYQLINVYVTVGLGSKNFAEQLVEFLRNPQSIADVLGKSVPAVSLYFCNLMIVKIFAAVPIEMLRPWQLSTIHIMYASMDTRKATRRDLRSGAFYAWPMLYGWVYPQLLMVLMIMMTYSTIAPLLPPFGVLFFIFAYIMYKYQLLYVYINDYQSGGFMWYAVFARSMVALLFASITLLGYLSRQLVDPFLGGPFWFTLPLPAAILYFWYYCDAKYKRQSMELAFGYAKTIDHSSDLAAESGRPRPLDLFSPTLYRQPSLLERSVFPEPHRTELLSRKHSQTASSLPNAEGAATYNPLQSPTGLPAGSDANSGGGVSSSSSGSSSSDSMQTRNRRGSMSLNVVELVDDEDESPEKLEAYFLERVIPLSAVPEGHIPGLRAPILDFRYSATGDSEEAVGVESQAQLRVRRNGGRGGGRARGGGRGGQPRRPAIKTGPSGLPSQAPVAERSLSDIDVGVDAGDEEAELAAVGLDVEAAVPSAGLGTPSPSLRNRKVSFDDEL